MTIESISTSILFVSIMIISPVTATEVTGKAIAFACSSCHGTDGLLKKKPGLPSLKSRPEHKLEKLLLDFKYEKTSSSIMGRITKGYTDAELKAVALYFSQL